MDRFFSQVSDVPMNTNKLEGGFLAKYSKFMKGPCLDSCTSHCSACLLLPATRSKVPFDDWSSTATKDISISSPLQVGSCPVVPLHVAEDFSKSQSRRSDSSVACCSPRSGFYLQLGPLPSQVSGKTIDCSRFWTRLLATFVLNLKVMCICWWMPLNRLRKCNWFKSDYRWT